MLIKETSSNYEGKILHKILSEMGYDSIKDFQKGNNLLVDGLFGMKSYTVLYYKYLNVKDINFNGYFRQLTDKNQIILHHSASADSVENMYNWWRMDGITHVATHIGICDDGTIGRGYDEAYWAHHIGMRNHWNLGRNMGAVAVEIMNWGYLTKKENRYYNYVDREIAEDRVIELNYRGHKYFEKYTKEEVESLRRWILVMAMRYKIPVSYNHEDMWNVSWNAIRGVPGIYTHNSFIDSKSDISPQPIIINMLKKLENYVS